MSSRHRPRSLSCRFRSRTLMLTSSSSLMSQGGGDRGGCNSHNMLVIAQSYTETLDTTFIHLAIHSLFGNRFTPFFNLPCSNIVTLHTNTPSNLLHFIFSSHTLNTMIKETPLIHTYDMKSLLLRWLRIFIDKLYSMPWQYSLTKELYTNTKLRTEEVVIFIIKPKYSNINRQNFYSYTLLYHTVNT